MKYGGFERRFRLARRLSFRNEFGLYGGLEERNSRA